MHHLEARRRVAQQPVRARDIARRQHEAVRAGRERLEQIAEHVAQAREALERAQLEHFVEQERARLAAGRARGVEEGEQHVERFARGRRLALRRRATGTATAPVTAWRKRSGVVAQRSTSMYCAAAAAEALAQPLQQHGASGAAAAEDDGNSRWRRFERAQNPSLEPSMLTRHSETPSAGPLWRNRVKSLWRPTLCRPCRPSRSVSRSAA